METTALSVRDSGICTRRAMLPIDKLKPSRFQVRDSAFNVPEEIANLANSIKSVGLLELPRVRKHPEDPGFFEIISGHRRIQAVSRFLGWKEIECEIYERLDDLDAFRLNVTENIQRSNLTPYEEGVAYLLCQRLFGFSDEELAIQLHKSRQTIVSKKELAATANRYLKYADSSMTNPFLRNFSISHKEVLSRLVDPQIIKHAVTMIARGSTVRNLQRFVKLFADESHSEGASYHSRHVCTRPANVNRPEEVLSSFEEIKRELPKKSAHRINALQNKYVADDPGVYRFSVDSIASEDRIFKCPSCGERFDLGRRLVPPKDRVFITISPKNKGLGAKKIVFSFPIFYKISQDS